MNVAPASAVIEMFATRHGEFTNAPHESPSSLSGRICQQWRLSLIVIGIATVVSTIVLYVLTNDARYVYMAAGAGLITAIFAMYVLYHYPYALDIQNALGSLREELGEQQELAHAQSQELRQQTELAAKQRVDLETLEQQLRVQKDLTTQQKQGLASLSIQLQTEQDLTTQQKQKLDALQAQLQDSQALASTQNKSWFT